MLNLRQSPERSVGDELNANVATNVVEPLIYIVPDDEDVWDLEDVVGVDVRKRVGVKRRF